MKILFAGTSSGVPEPYRYHSALLVSDEGFKLLVDCGASTIKALQHCKVDITDINSILITHFHADHVAGIPTLVTAMKIKDRVKNLTIYIHKGMEQKLRDLLDLFYLVEEKVPFRLSIIPFSSEQEIEIAKNVSFVTYVNTHIQNELFPLDTSSSLLLKFNGKIIGYTADVGNRSDLEVFNNTKLDCFIAEQSHIGFDDISEFVSKNKIKNVFLTHYHSDKKDLIDKKIAEQNLTSKVIRVEDFQEITL